MIPSSFAAAPAEEQWLQYRFSPTPWQYQVEYGYQMLTPTTFNPGLAAPETAGADRIFVKWNTPLVKDGFLWAMFERSKNAGQLDTLYFDTNCNGGIIDEEPVKAPAGGNQFGPVKIIFPTAEGPVTYHLLLMAYRSSQRSGAEGYTIYSVSACWYEGEVAIGDAKYKCALYDFNSNGAFNNVAIDFASSDRIRLFINDEPKSFFPGQYLSVADKWYHPEVSPDGAYVKFEPLDRPPMGSIACPSHIDEFALGGLPGTIYCKNEGKPIAAPVGTYRLFKWMSKVKDPSGVDWRITGSESPVEVTISVEEGKEVALDAGQPVQARLDKGKSGDGQYMFTTGLIGRMQERVTITLASGSMPPPPRLDIRNKDGTYERKFNFQYG